MAAMTPALITLHIWLLEAAGQVLLVQIEILELAALAPHHLILGLPSPTLAAELVVLIQELARYLEVRAGAEMVDMTPPLLQVERQI